MARNHGISMLPVVALVALLAAGAYNYHRNWQAEAAIPRPYGGYSQEDLAALLEAYETENAQIERQRERTRRALGQRGNGGLLDENIDAFEQAQQRSSAHRELGVKLSMRQTATEEIAAELERREREADVLQVHLKRLLTI